ncbi:hypothetical protein DFH11DRAFT_817868 [Phellopilus nigrolimitatus]|nr:hypothetical protein DFH11DRAFT_817868 [Phellopilus nigrolimitatus]
MTAPAKTKVASTRRERKKSTSLPKGVNTHPRPPPIKIKRTIPTPDPTPEPSPEPMEVDSDVDEDSEEDAQLYDLFSGVFESIPKPNMRVVDGEEICIPEFSYPSEDSHLVIDSGRVPCLASSSFYSPTAVQGVRVRNVASGSIEDERNPNEHFLRPTAPIWHAEADFNYWDDPMMTTDSSRAYDPCSSMGTIDVAAEQRALTVFLDDSF